MREKECHQAGEVDKAIKEPAQRRTEASYESKKALMRLHTAFRPEK